jgi:hypothetical protein
MSGAERDSAAMLQMGLIGVAAGAASALLFASVASGSLLSIPLFYLAPLPILIAAIGWSHLAGLIAAFVAAGSLAAALNGLFFLTFLIGIGLPAWWLGYLALLARPGAATNGEAPPLEWYPIGRIVLWAAVLGGLVVTIAMLNIASDADSLHAGLSKAFERLLRAQSGTPADAPLELRGISDPKTVIDFMILIVPPAAAVLTTTTNVISLWLAARIVRISGRLRRPWPDLSALTFPRTAGLALIVALVVSFLSGLPGVVGTIFTACLLMAYALLGLAVLHAVTQGRPTRGMVLGSSYALIIVFGWPILVMALVGIADALFDFRARKGPGRGPPSLQA